MDIDLHKTENETMDEFKARCLQVFIKYVESKFHLRHTFKAVHSEKPLNDTHIPPKGSVLCVTGGKVFYYYIPYSQPGSPEYSRYLLKSIYEFIAGPLKSQVVTDSAPYDLIEMEGLPEELNKIVARLVELKKEQKKAAKRKFGEGEGPCELNAFNKFMSLWARGDFRAIDDLFSEMERFHEYVSEVAPQARDYFSSLLDELAETDLSTKIEKIVFGGNSKA